MGNRLRSSGHLPQAAREMKNASRKEPVPTIKWIFCPKRMRDLNPRNLSHSRDNLMMVPNQSALRNFRTCGGNALISCMEARSPIDSDGENTKFQL